ncbi:MAG: sporulation protein YqfD [Oscillospiraceae bacterium]
MLTAKLIRYFKGSVRFKTQGVMGEELITNCVREKIPLSRIVGDELGFSATINIDDYKKVAKLSRKLGMRTKLEEKNGVRFLAFENRKRYGLVIGGFIFVFILSFLSSRVWNIDIIGNEKIPSYVILENLDKLGVSIGSNVKELDAVDVERSMLLNVDGLSFIAINFIGTRVEVQINEIRNKREIIDNDKQPTNVIAAKTGQIISIDVYDGAGMVKKGDTVQKGELIISGIIEGKTGMNHLKNARGKVIANVEETIEMKIAFDQTDYIKTSKTDKVRFIRAGKHRLNFTAKTQKNMPYSLEENSRNLELFGVKLPIEVGVDIYNYIQPQEIRLTREEAKQLCIEAIEEEEKTRFRNCKIISKTPVSKVEMNAYVINCRYLVQTEISEYVNIIID